MKPYWFLFRRRIDRSWKSFGSSSAQLGIIVSLLQLAAASYAAYFAWSQYQRNIEKDKVSAALEFIRERDKGATREASVALKKWKNKPETRQWFVELQKLPATERSEAYRKGQIERIRKDGYEDGFNTVFRYYRDAAICARSNVCDPDLMCEFTFNDFQAFRENFRPLIEDLGNSALELDVFAKRICATEFKDYCSEYWFSPYCQPKISPS